LKHIWKEYLFLAVNVESSSGLGMLKIFIYQEITKSKYQFNKITTGLPSPRPLTPCFKAPLHESLDSMELNIISK